MKLIKTLIAITIAFNFFACTNDQNTEEEQLYNSHKEYATGEEETPHATPPDD